MKSEKIVRPVPGLSRQAEEEQLKEIIDVAQDNLTRTENYIRRLTGDLDDLREVYGTKDKEALALFYNTQSQLSQNRRDLLRCRRARKKPYFGRIDFKDSKQPWEESYYIGRTGISKTGEEPLVIDRRAPVAGVYYEHACGPCRYTVQAEGVYEIDLKRKRTYEIEADRLKDFYDSDVVANDELLTQYLAKNKKAVLGEIIATIQKEQNEIIRQSPRTNMIVQGVAGSGKTTVAMHRISYILYNYEAMFRPQDFYIIGSNRILLDYITGVLPELDVYGVSQMTMEELFTKLMYEEWDPCVYRIIKLDPKEENTSMKGSYEWFLDLEKFCMQYEQAVIPQKEVRIRKNHALLLQESEIRDYLNSNSRLSMQGRIRMLNEMLFARLENELAGKNVSYTEAEKKELNREFRWYFGKDDWKGSIFEVYQQFLQHQKQNGKNVSFKQQEFDVYDLAALAYIYKRIKETDEIREASHVIIDEAQDFGMMAYGSLAYCLYGCTYTIMGDVSQNIHFGHGLNDWNGLKKLILTGTYDRFGILKKSYRNTVEISRFATEILRHGSFPVYPAQPVIRHGSSVGIKACENTEHMLLEMVKIILDWKKLGRETFAVICRDEKEAEDVRQRLGIQLSEAENMAGAAGSSEGMPLSETGRTAGAGSSEGMPLSETGRAAGAGSSESMPLSETGRTAGAGSSGGMPLSEDGSVAGAESGSESGMQLSESGRSARVQSLGAQLLAQGSSLDTAEFGSGILVLPVEYTKGLEFDAVLIYNPSAEHYPAEDAYVKLLYVAATRALHELAAVYCGTLTDLIAKPVSQEKKMQSFETDMHKGAQQQKEAVRYEKQQLTAREMERQKALQGEKEREKRSHMGPRLLSAHPVKAQPGITKAADQGLRQYLKSQDAQNQYTDRKNTRNQNAGNQNLNNQKRNTKREHTVINTSPYRFGQCPDNSLLYPKGHGSIDHSVRIIRRAKTYADFISRYGTLRLTPVSDAVIRVQFQKGTASDFQPGYWDLAPQQTGFWKAKEGKNLAEISTSRISVRINKKTGALQFYDSQGSLLLTECAGLPRQIQDEETWVYFDWPKSEKLYVKGFLADELERMNQKARYISFGGKKMRMPLLVSDAGYGIGTAAEKTAVCCTIPMYGQYVYTQGTAQTDYYFLFGGNLDTVLKMYYDLF